ncbi:hypothetical protein QE152_g35163 [Popillia japonica]|uniref:Uncharacterized protein n=1 Tax=Popillia japonica TaxID=7064 RepID=A0AAW1IQW4_POPJA
MNIRQGKLHSQNPTSDVDIRQGEEDLQTSPSFCLQEGNRPSMEITTKNEENGEEWRLNNPKRRRMESSVKGKSSVPGYVGVKFKEMPKYFHAWPRIQAEETDIGRKIAQRNKNINKEIEDAIDVNAGWKGLTLILDHDWPASCYTNTVSVQPKTLEEQKGNIAILTNPSISSAGGHAAAGENPRRSN